MVLRASRPASLGACANAGSILHDSHARSSRRSVDVEIAALAAVQHGVVSRAQLQALGVGRGAIGHRLANGRLHRVHVGVYAVGHPVLGANGRWQAAVLATGPGSALSHRSSAALSGLRPTARTNVDVTTPRGRHARPGIDVHRPLQLDPADVTAVDGIPCTTVARTLLDLGAVVDRRGVERACDQAEVLGLFDAAAIEATLSRAPGVPGTGVLRAVLDAHLIGTTLTRSELEERFLALCRSARVPQPLLNEPVVLRDGRSVIVDALWRSPYALVAEIDGFGTHGTRMAFEADRARDAELLLAGLRVVRFTRRRVVGDARAVGATLHALLT